MVKSKKGEIVTFARCLNKELPRSGVVESVVNKGMPDEKYVVISEGRSLIVKPSDITSSAEDIIKLRKKSKSAKPKSRKK